ncbi:unnamed protein product [Prorocentrum cordatum]|uniref:CN hydrolase domain-containing protein n=1 Tax=Prorocentrum cordatum TaxID=2364126 RepID=A0ABN9V4Y0_9DINO|nr:unnamed protein product [Polarella glacialis]
MFWHRLMSSLLLVFSTSPPLASLIPQLCSGPQRELSVVHCERWAASGLCRAIETQCYVLAAAQVGRHNEDGNKRESWGHSLAIDPWGRTLVNMGTTKGLAVVEIDSELVRSTRENMPIDRHRRYDIYGDAPHAATGHGATRSSRDAEDGMFFG